MGTLYDLKPAFQARLRPVVGWLARNAVTANAVTVTAMLLSVGYGAAILLTGGAPLLLLALPAMLLLRMGLNAADGMLAREHGQASRLGFFLNEIGDVVADAGLYLPLLLVLAPGFAALSAVAVLMFAVSELAGVLAQAAGGERRYDGPFGKSDRAAYFSLLAVVSVVAGLPPGTTVAAIAIAIAFAVATTVNRLRQPAVEVRHG